MRVLNSYFNFFITELESSSLSTLETTAPTMLSSRITTTVHVTGKNRATITSATASSTSQERSFTPSEKVSDTVSSIITDILTTAKQATTTTVQPTTDQPESSNNIR